MQSRISCCLLSGKRQFSVGGYLWDALSSRSLSPPNPLMAALERDSTTATKFSSIRPDHLTRAAMHVLERYESELSTLETRVKENDDQLSADMLVSEIGNLMYPVRNLLHLASLFHRIDPFDNSWLKACSHVAQMLAQTDEHSRILLDALESKKDDESVSESVSWELIQLIHQYKENGLHLDEVESSSLHELRVALAKVESKFQTPEEVDPNAPTPSTKERLQDLYMVRAMVKKEAEILGYDNPVERHLQGRHFSFEEIDAAHQQVSARANAKILDTSVSERRELEESVDLREFLTLDGTLGGLFALTRALFGIKITEDKDVDAWHREVRLFRVVEEDSNEPVGSFFLDPYFRPRKTRQTLMGPIFEEPKQAFIMTTIRSPVWNHLPTEMRYDDALDIFHEFGHVLQFLLANDRVLRVAGDKSVDVSEVLPQFMEHWLLEESILQTLAHFSQSVDGIPSEVVDKVRRQRLLQKTSEMSRRAFLGDLELQFYLRSDDAEESLVALQHRIANQHIPHDLPAKHDLTPLLSIAESNARGKHIAQYRYLLSEMISADLFSTFREGDINDPVEMRRIGTNCRRHLLEPVAFLDSQAFEKFTGRSLSTQALFGLYEF